MFYEPERRPFLKLARAIPICSYQGDLKAVASALKILKNGGIIGIFPEGQITYHGRSLKSPFAIAKFLKKAKVNVYVVHDKNAFLMSPPWTNKVFKGKVFTSMVHLFTPEQLEQLDEKSIYEAVDQSLEFDAGAYNEEHRHIYRLNDIDNLENLIYQCPDCGHEGLVSQQHKLVCPKCQRELIYDEYGLLDGRSLFSNYERQRLALEDLISKTPDYSLKTSVRLVRYQGNSLIETGTGTIILNRDYYIYHGTDKGQEVEYRFSTKLIQYLPVDIGCDIQIYDNYEVFQFYMDRWVWSVKDIIDDEPFKNLSEKRLMSLRKYVSENGRDLFIYSGKSRSFARIDGDKHISYDRKTIEELKTELRVWLDAFFEVLSEYKNKMSKDNKD